MRCGKGTYIRSLARDLGERLGCGAYVQSLRRRAVGPFTVANALTLDADASTARSRLRPTEAAVDGMPRVHLSAENARFLAQGRELRDVNAGRNDATEVAVFDGSKLIAVGHYDPDRRSLQPVKVLA